MNKNPQDIYINQGKELNRNFIVEWFGISLIFHLVLAWFSIGFYNFDEHFQILEFAGYKAGLIKSSLLTWEFAAQIRSTFQPYIAYVIIKLLEDFHTYDPFHAATILRLLSAILGWGSTLLMTLVGLQYIQLMWLRKFFIIISAVFVPIIFVHVRFSAEGWSGSLAFAGIAITLLKIQKKEQSKKAIEDILLLLSGFLMGLSYLCRFQAVIIVFVFMLWLLTIAKMPFKKLVTIGTGILIAVLLGILLDRMFYGAWVNTAYRYFDANIIKGVAANFGTEPWWWYITELAKNNFYYLQIPMMILVLIAFIKNLKNPIVWISIVFLLVHFTISHKEFRFLFLLADAVPLLLVLGIMGVISLVNIRPVVQNSWIHMATYILIFLNVITLINICLSPSCAFLYPMAFIYRNYHTPVDIIISDPYVQKITNGTPLRMNFYQNPGSRFIYLDPKNKDSVRECCKNRGRPILIMKWAKGFDQKKSNEISDLALVSEYEQFPGWLQKLDFGGWEDRTSFWHVYLIKPSQNFK